MKQLDPQSLAKSLSGTSGAQRCFLEVFGIVNSLIPIASLGYIEVDLSEMPGRLASLPGGDVSRVELRGPS